MALKDEAGINPQCNEGTASLFLGEYVHQRVGAPGDEVERSVLMNTQGSYGIQGLGATMRYELFQTWLDYFSVGEPRLRKPTQPTAATGRGWVS